MITNVFSLGVAIALFRFWLLSTGCGKNCICTCVWILTNYLEYLSFELVIGVNESFGAGTMPGVLGSLPFVGPGWCGNLLRYSDYLVFYFLLLSLVARVSWFRDLFRPQGIAMSVYLVHTYFQHII